MWRQHPQAPAEPVQPQGSKSRHAHIMCSACLLSNCAMFPYPPCVPTMEDKLGLCDINGVTIAVLVLRSQLLSQRNSVAAICTCPPTEAQLPLGASWLQRERVSQSAQPHTPAHTPSRLLLPLPIQSIYSAQRSAVPSGPPSCLFFTSSV